MLTSAQSEVTCSHCPVCRGDLWESIREGGDLCRSDDATTYTLARCLSCSHIMQVPPPDGGQLANAYSANYAPYRSAWKKGGWSLWRILRNLTTWRRVRRLKQYGKGNKLLEIGSGAGDFLYAAQRSGWQVHGIEYCKNLAEEIRLELGFDVRAGELQPGLWELGQFDAIVCWSVLEHVRDPLLTLQTASLYLKPGGSIFMQIPTRDGVLLGKRFGQFWALLDLPRHLNFFDEASLSRLCDRAGVRLTLYKTPLLDMFWCYLASSANWANQSSGLRRLSRLAVLTVAVLVSSPCLAILAWRGHGTEAFAMAVKKQ